ncbi:MAG: N-(5'-phosphoribosyl)anthranilate isomerase [Chryseolinea sp.]
MPLKTFVKVGSITNLSDARYCAGMGADMLGFNAVEGKDHYLSPKQFQEIRGWVTGPLVVAEVSGLQSAAQLTRIIENYQPDYLELGLAELPFLSENLIPFILRLDKELSSVNLPNKPAFILASTFLSNTISPLLIEVSSLAEAEQALQHTTIKGIALRGSAEISPGLKTYNELAEVLELLDAD